MVKAGWWRMADCGSVWNPREPFKGELAEISAHGDAPTALRAGPALSPGGFCKMGFETAMVGLQEEVRGLAAVRRRMFRPA